MRQHFCRAVVAACLIGAATTAQARLAQTQPTEAAKPQEDWGETIRKFFTSDEGETQVRVVRRGSRHHAKRQDRHRHKTERAQRATETPRRQAVRVPVPRPRSAPPELSSYHDGIAWVPVVQPPPVAAVPPTPDFSHDNIFRRYLDNQPHRTDLLPQPLRDLLAKTAEVCGGLKVVATGCWRGGHSRYVMGTRRVSLHCLNRAVDYRTSDYGCGYRVLRQMAWRGGINRDAVAMQHFHASWSPPETIARKIGKLVKNIVVRGREWGGLPKAFCHSGSSDPTCQGRVREARLHRHKATRVASLHKAHAHYAARHHHRRYARHERRHRYARSGSGG